MISASDITVVIPTYGREQVLVDSISSLLELTVGPGAILLVDQTPKHDLETCKTLEAWQKAGFIRRIAFSPPSIPHAMNTGLIEANTDYVLYLDDDIIPSEHLIVSYLNALNHPISSACCCILGQVLQPGEVEISFEGWKHNWFPFNSDRRQFVEDVIACNLCVERKHAIEIGGFDENFKGSAYKFESEFARRILRSGKKIQFEPIASIRHLRAGSGGTRAKEHHLTTWRPHHTVGKYYYAFLGGLASSMLAVSLQPLRAIRTKHHLIRPWWIPFSLLAELLGIAWALLLLIRGPRLIDRKYL